MLFLRRLSTVRSAAMSTATSGVNVQSQARAFLASEKLSLDTWSERLTNLKLTEVFRDSESIIAQIPTEEPRPQYLSVFKNGAVVMVNVPESNISEHLNTFPELKSSESESLNLALSSDPAKDCRLTSGELTLKDMSPKTIDAVTQVMAQAITVSQHETELDSMIKRAKQLSTPYEVTITRLHNLQDRLNMRTTFLFETEHVLNRLKQHKADGRYIELTKTLRRFKKLDQRLQVIQKKEDFVRDRLSLGMTTVFNNKNKMLYVMLGSFCLIEVVIKNLSW